MREMKIVTYDRTNLTSPSSYTFEDDRDGPTLSRMNKDGWQAFENSDLAIFRNSLGRFFIMKTVKETFMRKWFSDEEYDQVIGIITRWYDENHGIKIVKSRVTEQTRRIRATWPVEVEEELAARITEQGRRTISELQEELAEISNHSSSPYESSNYVDSSHNPFSNYIPDIPAELDVAERERRDRIYEATRGLRERYAIQPITSNEFRLSPGVDVIETDHTAIATSPNTVTDVSPWFAAAGFQRIPEIQSNRRL